MIQVWRNAIWIGVFCAVVIAGAGAAEAAGAIAVGKCSRFGWSNNYKDLNDARTRALTECAKRGDSTCEIVVTLRQSCGAFAVDEQDRCGARGWGESGTREEAERIARSYCHQRGGKDCKIKHWLCDTKR